MAASDLTDQQIKDTGVALADWLNARGLDPRAGSVVCLFLAGLAIAATAEDDADLEEGIAAAQEGIGKVARDSWKDKRRT